MKHVALALSALLVSSVVQAADVAATLAWAQRVELGLPLSGVVAKVNVAAGDRVKQGQVLLQLDDAAYRAQADARAASLPRLKEERLEAERDLRRNQELFDRTVLATTELDQARLRHARSQAAWKEGEANARFARKQLDDTQLRAPFDALVVARQAEPGMALSAGVQPRTLLVLARADEMLARAEIGAVDAARLQVGQTVSVDVLGKRYSGRIRQLALEPAAGRSGYAVEVGLAYQPGWRAGMPAKMILP